MAEVIKDETQQSIEVDSPPEVDLESAFEVSPEILEKEHKLGAQYRFWFMKRQGSNKSESYEKSIKKVGYFSTVEGFWRIYSHITRPNDLPTTTDFHLFKAGIKPMWEDPGNRKGGKWMIRLRKGIASRYWEDLLMAIVGGEFESDEICGAVLSIRYSEDILSLWSRNADDKEGCFHLRDKLREVLKLPDFIVMEYKRHDASLSDNSSFRNNIVWRSGGDYDNANTQGGGGGSSSGNSSHRNHHSGGREYSNSRNNNAKGNGRHRERTDSGSGRQHQQQGRGDYSRSNNWHKSQRQQRRETEEDDDGWRKVR